MEGGCSCGAVRYRLTTEPLFVHCCHCLNCQRQTGSAFVINLLIESDRVELLAAEPRPVEVERDDEAKQRIFRCPDCEIAVFSEYGRPEVRFVRAGTLDDPAAVAPDVHIYTRSKVPWVTLPPSVPAFDVYYDSKTLWPPEKLERLRAAFRAPSAGDKLEDSAVLELRPNCELCDADLPPESADARICSYECTFCATCVDSVLHGACPNCGGGFQPRPVRPRRAWREGTGLEHDPPGTRRRHTPYSRDELAAFVAPIAGIPPTER